MNSPVVDQKMLHRALRQAIGEPGRIVVLHSALYAFGISGEDLKWPLLGALRQLVREGDTLALPTFSFDFCRGQAFHHHKTASESGQLGDWFRKLGEVQRTHHPIYSFAVAGPRSAEILNCASSTTFGNDSPFGLFERVDARLVMLGCGWQSCTQFHHYEEEAQVPYRLYKTFTGEANFGSGSRATKARMFVRDLEMDPINDFQPAIAQLRGSGRVAKVELGRGTIEAVSCRDLGRTSRALLQQDPLTFVKDAPRVDYALTCRGRRATQPPLRVALLGCANLELLRSALESELRALIPDQRIEVYLPPFGQSERELLDSSSDLVAFGPQIMIFADRLEDVCRVSSLDEVDSEKADAALDSYLKLIEACAEGFQSRLLVCRFTRLQGSALGTAGSREEGGPGALVDAANGQLDRLTQRLPSCHGLDLTWEAQRFDGGEVFDPRLWHIGRFPFSQSFSEALARRAAGLILAATGRSVRLIALDLDNTLWGGVLGEDGIAGLQLGGDYPGNAYLAFQKALKRLSERGIALAVVSKNDETESRHALAHLPDMTIREADLAALRINWRDKPSNLIEIAQEIGLGLEHIAFVDDNPAERARMRMTLPAVKVIDLPDDPARYVEALLDNPYLECLELTDEDRDRAKRYAASRAARQARAGFARVEDFYAYLKPRLYIDGLNAGNAARAEQLATKTNQFNTTLKRYGRAELEALAERDAVYVLGLEDRFSERENIGLLVVDWHAPDPQSAEIDLFLLSCRVLGRGVESATLGWLTEAARQRGIQKLYGRVVDGPRNAPVRDLFQKHGFVETGESERWRLDIATSALRVPDWITLAERDRETADAA